MAGTKIAGLPVRHPFAESHLPEKLGWRRRPARDEQGREAWQLPDGMLLLLDPTGRSDSLLRPSPPDEPDAADVVFAESGHASLAEILVGKRWRTRGQPAA
jgi:hypothetical protein